LDSDEQHPDDEHRNVDINETNEWIRAGMAEVMTKVDALTLEFEL
jgi:hypothetical protein